MQHYFLYPQPKRSFLTPFSDNHLQATTFQFPISQPQTNNTNYFNNCERATLTAPCKKKFNLNSIKLTFILNYHIFYHIVNSTFHYQIITKTKHMNISKLYKPKPQISYKHNGPNNIIRCTCNSIILNVPRVSLYRYTTTDSMDTWLVLCH